MPVTRTSAPTSSPRPAAICSVCVIGVARLGDLGAPGGIGQEKRERFVEEFTCGEAVVEYRCVYGTEQWLVKWKGYDEERNTWEPEANLLTTEVQAEAAKVREAGLPRTAAGLQKAVVVTLKSIKI